MSDVAERMRDYGSNPMVQSEYSMVLARELLEVADEIERLRDLLEEALDSEISDYWYVRVREALGYE